METNIHFFHNSWSFRVIWNRRISAWFAFRLKTPRRLSARHRRHNKIQHHRWQDWWHNDRPNIRNNKRSNLLYLISIIAQNQSAEEIDYTKLSYRGFNKSPYSGEVTLVFQQEEKPNVRVPLKRFFQTYKNLEQIIKSRTSKFRKNLSQQYI